MQREVIEMAETNGRCSPEPYSWHPQYKHRFEKGLVMFCYVALALQSLASAWRSAQQIRQPQDTSATTSYSPEKDWAAFIETVRARILDYTEKLPDFTCVQITKRYSHPPPDLLYDAMGRSVKIAS